MDDTDAFFTQTIIGPPVSVMLGPRLAPERLSEQGLEAHPTTGRVRLTALWREWVLLGGHGATRSGRPRQRPGAWRRRLERHALWLAAFGLLCLLASLVLWLAARHALGA